MIGSDGRLYDEHFDYDHDGKLNAYERAMFDDSFKSSNTPRNSKQSCFTLLYHCGGATEFFATILWAIGFITCLAFPPIGVLIIVIAVTMTERK